MYHYLHSWLLDKLMFGDYCVSCNFWLWQCQSCEPIRGKNSKICLFDWMAQFSLFDQLLQELEKKMMIVYCAHVNLHTELVKMDSSCVWMSVLTRRLMTDPLEKTWLWWAEIPIELTVATYKWLAKTGIFISSILDYLPLDLFMHHQAWFAAKHTNGLHVYILYLMYYAYSTYIRCAPLPDHLPLTECVKCKCRYNMGPGGDG